MKRYISILMILIILFCSNAFAVLIDVTKEVPKDNTLVYPDLQEVAIDDRGNQKFDRYTKELLYVYHEGTNEILKATAIGLIEGYEDGTFRPNASISKAEFIKLAIVLSTNRNFDFSAIPF